MQTITPLGSWRMPDDYIEMRERRKQAQKQWTTGKRLYSYGLMLLLVTGLAVFPMFGLWFLLSLVLVLALGVAVGNRLFAGEQKELREQ